MTQPPQPPQPPPPPPHNTLRPEDIPQDQRPPGAGAWGYLVQSWDDGLFTVEAQPDGTYSATFHDDGAGEVIPLRDMAYNHDLGLFRRSAFPLIPDTPAD